MRKVPYVVLALLGVVLLFGSAWAFLSGQLSSLSQSGAAAAEGRTGDDYVRSDDGEGSVQLTATLLVPSVLERSSILAEQTSEIVRGEELGVLIGLNTHSVDLSGYDLAALSSLTSPGGTVRPLRYLPQQDETHHRSGFLVFAREGIALEASGELVLVLRDVGGVPTRALTWQLPAA